MTNNANSIPSRRVLVNRFWSAARGFWIEGARRTAWLLTVGLVVLVQLTVQYRPNIWNRDLFNAIEKKDGTAVLTQAGVFLPLVMATVFLAVIAVYGRMKMQREWRAWFVDRIIGNWLAAPDRSFCSRSTTRMTISAQLFKQGEGGGQICCNIGG